MGRKPNTPLSNIATTSSPDNSNWHNARYTIKIGKHDAPPLPAEVMHDLVRWSLYAVVIKRQPEKTRILSHGSHYDNKRQHT